MLVEMHPEPRLNLIGRRGPRMQGGTAIGPQLTLKSRSGPFMQGGRPHRTLTNLNWPDQHIYTDLYDTRLAPELNGLVTPIYAGRDSSRA